jgi:hypothetical protein
MELNLHRARFPPPPLPPPIPITVNRMAGLIIQASTDPAPRRSFQWTPHPPPPTPRAPVLPESRAKIQGYRTSIQYMHWDTSSSLTSAHPAKWKDEGESIPGHPGCAPDWQRRARSGPRSFSLWCPAETPSSRKCGAGLPSVSGKTRLH